MQENINDPLGILSSKDPLGILKKKDGGGPKPPISTSQYVSPLPQEELPLGIPQQKRSVSQEALTAREKINKSISESDDILTRLIRENRLSAFETQQQSIPQLDGSINPAAQSAKRFLITQSPVTPDEVVAKKQQAMSDDKTAREVLKRVAKKDPTIASSAYIVDAQQRAVPEKENQILANADKIARGELIYNINKGILQQPQGVIESGIRGFKERATQIENYEKYKNAVNPEEKIKILEEGFASYDPDKPVPVPEGASAQFAEMFGMEGIPMLKSATAATITGLIPGAQAAAPLVAAFAASPEYYKRSYESGLRSAYYELRQRGKTPEEALAVAEDQAQKEGIIGAAEGAVSSALGARIGFKPASIVQSPVMKGALGKAVSASANVVRQMAPEAAADAGAAGLLQIASNLTARDNGLDRGVFDGVQENIAGEVGFTIGMGILTKGGRRLVDPNTYRTILNGFARQPKSVTDAKLGEMIVTGAITPEDAVDVSREIERERGLDAQIPKTIPETVRPQISEMIEKRNDLKQQLASANEAFHPTIKEEINSIDQQILSYATNESQVQEGRAEGNLGQPQGTIQGQPEVGQGTGSQGQTQISPANVSDSNIGSEGQVVAPELSNIESVTPEQKKEVIRQKFDFITDQDFVQESFTQEEDIADRSTLPDSGFANEQEFKNFLETGEYAMLTGQNPEAIPVSKEANKKLNDRAKEWLSDRGLRAIPIFGKYGNSERSFMVPDMTKSQAIEFAKDFSQDSVAHSTGLVFKDGSFNPRQDGVVIDNLFDKGEDNFSSINISGSPVDFKISFDFDTTIPSDAAEKSTMVEELLNEVFNTPIEKARQSLSPTGVDIQVVSNPAEYDAQVEQLGGQRGTEGVFLSNEGRILLNEQKLKEGVFAGRIIWHEASHPVMNIVRNTNPDLYNRVLSGLKQVDNPAVKQAIQWANENYEGQGTIDDESIVETVAMVADGTLDLDAVPTGLKQSIIDFINLLARALGFNQVLNDTDVAAFKKLAGQIADALTSGRNIGEVVGRENVKEYGVPVGVPTQAKVADKYGPKVKHDGGSYKLSFVKPSDIIDIKGLIKEIADSGQKVWFWTADQLGRGMYYDNVIEGEHYLDAGPSFALDPKNRDNGVIWATGKGEKWVNDKIANSDYIFIISGSPQKSKLFNKRVAEITFNRVKKAVGEEGAWDKFKSEVLEVSKIGKINEILNKYNSFEDLLASTDRKELLIQFDAQKEKKGTPLKGLLEKYGAFVDYNDLRDGFFKDNDFKLNDVMLVLKPTGYGGKSAHSTYENDILGEVVGVPDRKVNAYDIMPDEFRAKYAPDMSRTEQSQAVAPYGAGVRSIQASAGGRDLTGNINKKLTDDGQGNYVFFHYSGKKLNKIDPSKFGANLATGRDERPGVGLSMYYVDNKTLETGVPSDFGYAVRIPKDKVYPFNEDPLNFYDQAKAEFEKDYPGQSFDANKQIGYITKVANDNGFDITVADWNIKGRKALRAQTTKSLKPEVYKQKVFKNGSEREQFNEELQKLKPGVQASVGSRLAPNGKPSNLTEQQYNQVRTPEFKNWFGDWENDPANASKVVDENGEPLVVFHGTRKSFDTFDAKANGVFFAKDPEVASSYAVQFDDSQEPNIIPAFLNIRSLETIDAKGNGYNRIPVVFNVIDSDTRGNAIYRTGVLSTDQIVETINNVRFPKLLLDEAKPTGVKIENVRDEMLSAGDPTEVYIALNSNQIKSATGNVGTFSTTDNRIQASVGNRDIINGFYSPIEDRINTFKQPKASVQKWKEIVGVKSDEAVYSGMSDWLGGKKPDQQLSKEEVLQFMKDNRIEINEVVKGDKIFSLSDDKLMEMNDLLRQNDLLGFDNIAQAREAIRDDEDFAYTFDVQDQRLIDLANEYRDSVSDFRQDATKYSKYQLPGGENYKEVLITLPGKKEKAKYSVVERNGLFYPTDTARNISQSPSPTRQQAQQNVDRLNTTAVERESKDTFKSTHFDEPNIITHLRMNTRTDADGKKVLFLEEVQSDWGQKGKREGFKKGKAEIEKEYASVDKRLDDLNKRLDTKYGEDFSPDMLTPEEYSEYSAAATSRARLGSQLESGRFEGIQPAPFVTNTNAWVKLGLKVALKEAVKQGADRIAWTTGDQQNERYDLRKQVDSIAWEKDADGTYAVTAEKNGSTISSQTGLTPAKLEEAIGKDAAEKIVNSTEDNGVLEGNDLAVGGKGMKAFYGDANNTGIVGNVAKALVKELTGKEGQILPSKISSPRNQDVIDRYNRARQYGNVPDALAKEYEQAQGLNSEQPAIDITPELSYAVTGGMPQFSIGNRPENNPNFKLGAFVMRKKAEGATDGEIAIAIASVTGMKPEDIKTLIDNPEQYIRDMFPSMTKLQQDNLIQKAKIQNIYRGRQFGKPIDKAFTGLEVPQEYVDEYMNKTAKSDNAVKEWATDFKNKWLDPAKGLPDWVLAIKDFASGSKNIEIARAAKTIERLKDQAKKIGFTDWDAFGKALVVAKDVKRYIPNEDGVVPFDAYRAAAGKMFTTPDDQLPALVPDEIKALPDEIIPYVYAMRGQIDNLTRDLIGFGYVTPEQAVNLEKNIGSYVNRSYRMFNEMGYKPEPEVKNAAIKFLADDYVKEIATDKAGTLSYKQAYDEAIQKAEKDIEAILNKKKNPYFNASVDRRNTGILQERQDIPEPLRKLMGEYTDPGTVFMMTVAKQAALKASSQYLNKLRENGMGTLFFEKDDPSRPLSHSVQIASPGSESMNPLGGLYTTPEIAEAIYMAEPTYNNFTQVWMKLVGAVRWGKTVGSVATQFKNFESNLGFAVLNGYLMSGQNTAAFKASAKYVKGQYSKAEIDAITDKAIRLNLVGQSVGARELKEMLGSGDVHDIALDISLGPDGKWGKKVAKKLNVFKQANKLYRLGDDFWKVYAYMTEREQLSDARFSSKYDELTKEQQDQIDVESSERVKNTWPTYDRVVELAKVVSKNAPIFGNFISFQAESLRVLANSIKLAKQDMADPQLRHLGVRRAVGIAAYFGLRSAITIGLAKTAGFAAAGVLGAAFGDDEEERNKRAIKQALPPFMRTSDLAVIRTKDPHKFTVISLSSLDPYAIIPNSLNAYTDGREGIFGKTMDPGVGAATAEIFSSFLEPEMTFNTMWSTLNNIDPKTKEQIVLGNDTNAQAAVKVGGKVWDMLEPSSVALVQRFFERKDKEAEILAIGGARPYDVDLHKSFGYILSQFGKDIDAINREYNSIKYREGMSQQDKNAAEMAAEDKKAFAISKLNETYRDFMNLGADPKVLNELINQRSAIKVTGFDKNTKNSIKTGKINKKTLFK